MPDTLEAQIKSKLVEVLELEMKPEDIADTQPLFGDASLGLDSVDALEIVSALEFKYKLRFPTDGSARDHFKTVETLADFVAAQGAK